MSHFMCVVLVPKRTRDIKAKVAKLLVPYDENKKVKPYISQTRDKVQAKKEEVTEEVNSGKPLKDYLQEYKGKIEKMSLKEFAKSWYEQELDEDGNLLSTYNKKSKWDFWRIGGRWDGEIKEAPRQSDNGLNFSKEHEALENNVCPVSKLPKDFSAFAVVAPDGEWHEKAKMGWWAIQINPKDEAGWDLEQAALFETYKDCVAVACDCHI